MIGRQRTVAVVFDPIAKVVVQPDHGHAAGDRFLTHRPDPVIIPGPSEGGQQTDGYEGENNSDAFRLAAGRPSSELRKKLAHSTTTCE
jgi:hypothetical protein